MSKRPDILVYRNQPLKECEWQYRDDPEAFIWDILGVRGMFKKSLEFVWSVAQNRKTVARGCYGSAKTFYLACIALWFLYTRYNSRVITTAPTMRQVRDLLWAEINSLHGNAKILLGGKPLQNRLQLGPKWFAIGLPASQKNESAIQGYHGENVFVALDEASGIRGAIFELAERLAVGGDDRIAAIGNAIDPLSHYAGLFKASDWAKIVITAFDTPNVVYRKQIIPGMVSHEWVEEKRKKWGENSQLYRSRVLAEFPMSSENAMIPLSWIEAAMNRYEELIEEVREADRKLSEEQAVEILAERWAGRKALGVDVAGTGEDDTVLAPRIGSLHMPLETHHGLTTQEIAGMIVIRHRQGFEAAADVIGIGAGVAEAAEAQGVPVVKVVGSERSDKQDATGSFGFTNKRTELYWTQRECLSPDLPIDERHILPRDELLMEELAIPTYTHVVGGKIKMENKDSVKARLGRSPDRADSTVNSLAVETGAFAYSITRNEPTQPAAHQDSTQSKNRSRTGRRW
ncbi:hypothetical protein HUU59_10980 [bacterium]|nr:hypothetical protein [bacterium]